MNLQQLNYILEVERYGSMNKAAKNLLVSQPWLSVSIRDLEEELNFRIFDRTSKGVVVTVEGKEFLKSVHQLMSQIDRIQTLYERDSNREMPSVLSVSSGRYSFITKLCIDFYHLYFEEAKKFQFYMDESNCQTVVSNIFEQKFELGIIHVSGQNDGTWEKKLEEKGIEFHFLFESFSCVILRKEHPLLQKKSLVLENLLEYPLFHSNGRLSKEAHFDETPDIVPYWQFKKNIYTNNRNFVFQFLLHSDAIFIGNSNYSLEQLQEGLTSIPYPGEGASWKFYWIRLKKKSLSRTAQRFVSLLEQYQPEKNGEE